MPCFMAELMGIDLKTCSTTMTVGIEGRGIMAHIVTVRAKIENEEFNLRSLISERDTTPFILGRVDFFDQFSITFDNQAEVLRLTRVDRGQTGRDEGVSL